LKQSVQHVKKVSRFILVNNEMDICDDEVIRSLRNSTVARRLVKHPRNARILNTKGAYYYLDKNEVYQPLSGLLPRLHATFYPTTDIYRLIKQPKELGIQKRKRQKRGTAKHDKHFKKPKGRYYGKIRGTIVHQELADLVLMNVKTFLKKHGSMHSYTHKIMTFILEKMKWRLLRAEFDIFDEVLGIGTSVDLVAVTTEGKLVLIEVKCGYAEYFDHYQGQMLRSMHKLTDSPHHQANLQIISAALIIARHHQIPLDEMLLYVIRVDDKDLYDYKINNRYVHKKGAKIYRDLTQ
jgi:hypothetical protein